MFEALPVSGPAALPLPAQSAGLGVPARQDLSTTPGVIVDSLSGDRVSTVTLEPVSQEKIISRRSASKRRLKLTQEAVLKHYANPHSPLFGNGKQSYLQVHPNVTPASAGVLASRLLDKVNIQAVVRESWGVNKLEDELEWNIQTCKQTSKLADHREGIKVLAQLTGQWKERQEITHLDDAQKDAIRRTVSEALGSN